MSFPPCTNCGPLKNVSPGTAGPMAQYFYYGPVCLFNLDESFLLGHFAVDEVAVVVAADVPSTQTPCPAPEIAARLRRRDHVKRHRQRSAFVDVVHPQTGPRELPLDIAVRLKHQQHHHHHHHHLQYLTCKTSLLLGKIPEF